MKSESVSFENDSGVHLSAIIDYPEYTDRHLTVIFAHCFTCNKNLPAVHTISKSLTGSGFTVLRFDFTGLGSSEGDFSQTNFSSNQDDLISAARFLENEIQAPDMLVGHSLGGAAVLETAHRLDSVKAVATIGSPSNPGHVTHLLEDKVEEIEKKGKAKVNIGGRGFTIQKHFLDDLEESKMDTAIREMGAALLIFHSPVDNIVGIENAAGIFQKARHPKSFVSLDDADHLLSEKEDSEYVASVLASWAKRYLRSKDK